MYTDATNVKLGSRDTVGQLKLELELQLESLENVRRCEGGYGGAFVGALKGKESNPRLTSSVSKMLHHRGTSILRIINRASTMVA